MLPLARLPSRGGPLGSFTRLAQGGVTWIRSSAREDKTRKSCSIKENIMFRFRKPALTAEAATHRLAGNQAHRLGYPHFADPARSRSGASHERQYPAGRGTYAADVQPRR